jgi:hypothetical protein
VSPEDIFAIHPNIRWVGVATSTGKVLFSQMRQGVTSLTPEEDDRAMLELRAQFLTEMTEHVAQWAGAVNYIAISYEKFIELIVTLKAGYAALTLEKDTEATAYKEIARAVQAVKMQYPVLA